MKLDRSLENIGVALWMIDQEKTHPNARENRKPFDWYMEGFNDAISNIPIRKDFLIPMIIETPPNFDVMDHDIIRKLGEYNKDNGWWIWNRQKLSLCSEKTLLQVYLICEDSWKNVSKDKRYKYPGKIYSMPSY